MKTILEYPGIPQVSIKISCIYNFASSCASPTVTVARGASADFFNSQLRPLRFSVARPGEKNAGCIKGGAPYQLLLGWNNSYN